MESGYAQAQHDLMSSEYERFMRQELDALRSDERPMDLLVLVPAGRNCPEREWALTALKRLRHEHDYIDYTDDSQRRVPSRPQSIRVSTFHSARGIEGSRVLVFGVEQLRRIADSTGIAFNKLAYIALSRSIFECTLIVPSTKSGDQGVVAIEHALACLRGVSTPEQRAEIKRQSSAVRPAGNVFTDWVKLDARIALRMGDRLRHPEHGDGTVVHQKGVGGDVVVDFATSTLIVPPAPELLVRQQRGAL